MWILKTFILLWILLLTKQYNYDQVPSLLLISVSLYDELIELQDLKLHVLEGGHYIEAM